MRPALADRPVDPTVGVVVPFAVEDDDGVVDHARVVKRRATRCALSRICGLCGDSLEWPIAFVGTDEEVESNSYVFPPLHTACAEQALATFPALGDGYLGRPVAPARWALVHTGGFDLERPANRTGDQRLLFHPHSVTDTTWVD
ncbi:hypothetical protein [Solicola sp. PLA-1-18]|uniref:hypothetical protein n=1 Tax=Solicola sp. PLA-1-18 TaxID=3380532 RepID=UPI003B7774C2